MADTPSMWDKKNLQYKNKQLRARLWKDQAKLMKLEVNHIQIGYRDLRDWNTKLHKPTKSGQGPREPTEREKILMARFTFLQDTVRHRVAPVQTIASTLDRRDRDPDQPTDLDQVERMETEAGTVDAISQADSYTTTGTPINPKKKKKTEEDLFNEKLINQLGDRDAHLEKLTDRLSAMQDSTTQPDTPRRHFCDWAKSELMAASQVEFRQFEKSFLAMREGWVAQRERKFMLEQQRQMHQQRQVQQQEWQQQQQPQPTTVSHSPHQFQTNPANWAPQNPLAQTSLWESQTPAYNSQYQRLTTPPQQQQQPQRPATSTLTTPPMAPPESPSGMLSQMIADAPTPGSDVSLNLDLFDTSTDK